MVGSGLILLSTVVHYLQCGAAVPAVAPPIAHALPVLLRGYHTHAYKQVLMAGAMLPTSAGEMARDRPMVARDGAEMSRDGPR